MITETKIKTGTGNNRQQLLLEHKFYFVAYKFCMLRLFVVLVSSLPS